MSLDNKVVGFIGGGNMAKAITEGLLKKGLVKASQVMVSSPSDTTLDAWRKLNVTAVKSNAEVISAADIVFLSFKPYQLNAALSGVNVQLASPSSKLFVSILAGVTSQTVFQRLKMVHPNPRVIRVMPNTPAMVCEGCSAIAAHSSATEEDVEIVQKVFSAIGLCEVVPETLISAVTGLTGSGPAYVYMAIEALSDGAVKQGLPRAMATAFAAQMVLGSAKMVLETGKHPGQLKDDVCSAGGTTIHAVHALERSGMRAAFMNAIEAAVQRGDEIGRNAQ